MPFRRWMVALSRTESDAGLLQYAAALLRHWDSCEVHCVHVAPDVTHDGSEPQPVAAEGPDSKEFQASVLAQLGGLGDQIRISFHLLRGVRLDGLLHFSAEHAVDLVLLGHRHGRSGRRSLARRLAMKAPCSVWMVPEGSPSSIRNVLVPVDFSGHSADSLSVATHLASHLGLGDCLALHVYFNEAVTTYEGYDEVIRGREQEAFERFVEPLNLHGVRVQPLFVEGASVPHGIEKIEAEHAIDLTVMSTRGRSRSAAVLLGSETEHTLIETPIPILVVKHFGARLNLLSVLLDKKLRERQSPRFD